MTESQIIKHLGLGTKAYKAYCQGKKAGLLNKYENPYILKSVEILRAWYDTGFNKIIHS